MAKQFVVRSPKLDRAIGKAIHPYAAKVSAATPAEQKVTQCLAYRQTGHFDVIYDEENNKLVVCNSSAEPNDNSTIAGYVYIGSKVRYGVSETSLTPANGHLYLKGVKSGSGYLFSIAISENLPNDADICEVIGDVYVGGGEEGKTYDTSVSIYMARALGDLHICDVSDTGHFDCVYNAGTNKVDVCDSNNPTSQYAGFVYVANSHHIAKQSFTPVNGMYVYVLVDYNDENDQYVCTIEANTVLPSYDASNPTYYEVLAQVAVTGGTSVSINKSRPLGDIRVLGRWL